MRRFGDQQNETCQLVFGQRLERLEEHDAPDFLLHVAASGANGLRDAGAGVGNEATDLLQTRPSRGDNADAAPIDGVGKGQRNAVDDGRAAVRAHHQQPPLPGKPLQRDLLFQGHVVRKQHDVQPPFQGSHRQITRVATCHRNQRQIRPRQDLQRPVQAHGMSLRAGHGFPGSLGQQSVRRSQGRFRRLRRAGLDCDQQIGITRAAELGNQQPAGKKNRPV